MNYRTVGLTAAVSRTLEWKECFNKTRRIHFCLSWLFWFLFFFLQIWGLADQTESFKFSLDPPLLPW